MVPEPPRFPVQDVGAGRVPLRARLKPRRVSQQEGARLARGQHGGLCVLRFDLREAGRPDDLPIREQNRGNFHLSRPGARYLVHDNLNPVP